MTSETLTGRDAITLGQIVSACQRNQRVEWLVHGGPNTMDGVARAITDENGNFLPLDVDVRDGFVWISATFEHFLPVRDVMRMVRHGEMALTR